MEHTINMRLQSHQWQSYDTYVLGADIGGSNTDLAIAGIIDNKPQLLFSFHFKTKELTTLLPAIQMILEYTKTTYDITVHSACIGAAGITSSNEDSIQLTNANWNISSKKIKENTLLKKILLINDFQLIGYGINFLDHDNPQDIHLLQQNQIPSTANKAILGAGTGLGKTILTHNPKYNAYIPLPSEGGHSDLPVYTYEEQKLYSFIQNYTKQVSPLCYEDVLSGRGIERLYMYVQHTKQYPTTPFIKEIDAASDKPVLISKYRTQDETCKKTFELFTRFYARCAKNIALDALATGGIYIAGGIASKNKDIFDNPVFLQEFHQSLQRKEVLQNIPLYLIMNYDVSLYGACFAAEYHKK